MAGEFVHADVGGELTEAEYHLLLAHILKDQARGDLIMSNAAATGLIRLPKGTQNQRFLMGANDPGWGGDATEAELTELTDGSETTLHSHAGGGATTVRKTADETVNNSSTFQSDDHLSFSIGANEVWVAQFHLYVITNSTADFKVSALTPSGASPTTMVTGAITGDKIHSTNPRLTGDDANVDVQIEGGDTKLALTMAVLVVNGGTAGTVYLRWAQNTATAVDTKVLSGSLMVAHKI